MEENEEDCCSVATSDFIKIGQSADEQGGHEGGEFSNDGRHMKTADLGFSDIGIDIGGGGNAQQLKWHIEALKTKNQMLVEKLRNLELEQKCAKLEQKMRDQSMERKLEEIVKDVAMLKEAHQKEIADMKTKNQRLEEKLRNLELEQKMRNPSMEQKLENGQKRMEEIAKDMAMLKKAQQKEIPEWKYPPAAWDHSFLLIKHRSLFAEKSGNKDEEEEKGADEEFTPNGHFEPLVELPPEVEVFTGEEDEEIIFVARCKLYRYDRELKENKERGQGDIKILRNPITQKCCCVMRREKVLKLCANFPLLADLNVQQHEHMPTVYTWACKDFSENPASGEDVTFSVRFKDASITSEFNEKIKEAVEATKQWQAGLMKEGIQPNDN